MNTGARSGLAAGWLVPRRAALLLGTSVFALQPAAVHAGPPAPALSPAWFAGRASAGAAAAPKAGLPASSAPGVQASLTNLTRAAQAIAAVQSLQASARLLGPSGVPNGLAAGGLQRAPGAAPGSPLWAGANLPAQAAVAGRVQVTVKQTAPQAILNWTSFNVGAQTDLVFDQSAGAAAAHTWAVLNRIPNPVGPSQILGTIRAQGQVLVINGNGILFGAGSQVNVNSLLASTGNLADSAFTGGGTSATLPTGIYGSDPMRAQAVFVPQTGAIFVQAGAVIATDAPATPSDRGGAVLLMAETVANAGAISTPGGQTILAAGSSIALRQGFSVVTQAGKLTASSSTTLGTEAEIISGGGLVTNSGVIQATTGDVTMVGRVVTQAGVITSTTSVNQRGTIHLLTDLSDPAGSVTLGPGSVTAITPDTAPASAIDSQRTGNIDLSFGLNGTTRNPEVPLNNQAALPDRLDLSRIEVSSGGLIDARAGSLTSATGGQIALFVPYTPAVVATKTTKAAPATGGRVLIETGAALDVAGALDVVLPASADAIPVTIEGNELRDSPVNRDAGTLLNQKVMLDARQLVAVAAGTGGDAAARDYTAGGLLEVSGELGNVTHAIGERLAVGGTITLSGSEIVAQPGASFNIAGGSMRYQAGSLPQTYLIGPDGRLYNVNTAPSDLVYTGVYGGFEVGHPRWGFTDHFNAELGTPATIDQPGYSVGRDGGALVLSAPTVVFEAAINAGVVQGEGQTAARPASSVTLDAYALAQTAAPVGGALLVGNYTPTSATPLTLPLNGAGQPALVAPIALVTPYGQAASLTAPTGLMTQMVLGDPVAPLAGTIAPMTALPAARVGTAYLSVSTISAAGLGALSLSTAGTIAVTAPVALGTGGAVTLAAARVTVSAPLTARGGSVSIVASGDVPVPALVAGSAPGTPAAPPQPGSVTLTGTGAIDTRGVWTNALLDPSNVDGEAFANGGAVSLDAPGAVSLGAGSAIDASAGGALLASGKVTAGTGGAITLIAYDQADPAAPTTFVQAMANPALFAGTLRSAGLTGGALTMQAPAVTIADAPVADPGDPSRLLLTPAFFAQGFSSYTINGLFDTPPMLTQGVLGSSVVTGALTTARIPAAQVATNTVVTVAEPVYQPALASRTVLTGGDPAAVFDLVLPPLYQPNPATAVLTQRAGASLTLESQPRLGTVVAPATPVPGTQDIFFQTGAIAVGAGSVLKVDPGTNQAVTLRGNAQITVDGTIRAQGGAISVIDTRLSNTNALAYVPGLSVWIGGDATLDASGMAAIAADTAGRPFGFVTAGGTVTLGARVGAGGTAAAPVGSPIPIAVLTGSPAGAYASGTDAFVIVRPGAVVDVSGASAVIDHDAGEGRAVGAPLSTAPVFVPSAAGTINLASSTGIFAEGTLQMASGGAGAAGGTLSVTLNDPPYAAASALAPGYVLPLELTVPREILVSQHVAPGLPGGLVAGGPDPALLPGRAAIAADGVAASGADALILTAADTVVFNGGVTLQAARQISLQTGVIASATPSAAVQIASAYVALNGLGQSTNPDIGNFLGASLPYALTGAPNTHYNQSAVAATATLTIAADLVDITGQTFGGIAVAGNFPNDGEGAAASNGHSTATKTSFAYDRPGFASVTIASAGDVRFAQAGGFGGGSPLSALITPGALTVNAGQLYPLNGVQGFLVAGFDLGTLGNNPFLPNGTLTIGRIGTTPPAPPVTAGGSLALAAGQIVQDGVVRAPFGQVDIGTNADVGVPHGLFTSNPVKVSSFQSTTDSIALMPGSVTSVSGAGSLIPYGGTGDGVSYTVNGTALAVGGTSSTLLITAPVVAPAVLLAGQTVTIAPGATLDLSGGGVLTGAAFVPGRGGSTDVLASPLLNVGPAAAYVRPGDAVYAVIPGVSGGYAAPAITASGTDAALPALGAQITLAASAGGLPAGTYTLLPAIDALLPGGFRVELNTTVQSPRNAAVAIGTGSFAVNAYRSLANTTVRDALPIEAVVTPGATVRSDATYNETPYGQYVTNFAAQFGNVRSAIPADAGQLQITFVAPAYPGLPSLAVDGRVALQGAAGGRGGIAEIGANAPLEITADGQLPSTGTIGVQASDLNRLGAATLSLGALLINTTTQAPALEYLGSAPSVTVRSGARLAAPEVFLAAPIITVEQGAIIDTIGRGTPALDLSFVALDTVIPVNALVVSNAAVQFAPQTAPIASTTINVGTCAVFDQCADTTELFAQGTLAFSSKGATVFGPGVLLGASALNLSVGTVNLGTETALLAANVPAGFDLSQTALASLLAGSPDAGAPPLRSLVLTASQSINTFGTVDFNTIDPATGQSSLSLLQFNTPAIYGFGAATDSVTLSTGTLVWNGIAVQAPGPGAIKYIGAAAPLVTPGGPGTGAGTFTVLAKDIVLGYGPGDQANSTVTLQRSLAGYATSTLSVSDAIVANSHGTLTVGAGGVGALNLVTPLMTGAPGAVLTVTAAGAIAVQTPGGASATVPGQGASLTLTSGSTLSVAGTIALPSGALTLNAPGAITLASGALLDVSGHATTFFDQVRYGFGGTVDIAGGAAVTEAAGAAIDVSAIGTDAGTITIVSAGRTTLDGALRGASVGTGGAAGRALLHAQTLAVDGVTGASAAFAAVNATLDAGGIFGTRDFEVRTGDLAVGGIVRANTVAIAVDSGALAVTGTIDASGAKPGTITLSAQNDVTIGAGAMLDAHATVLHTDSFGVPIASENRADVTLTTTQGTLTLAAGATIDVRSADGVARGTVSLNAPRTEAGVILTPASAAVGDGIAIAAPGPLTIRGAASVALYGFKTYAPTDPGGTITQIAANAPAGAVVLSAVDADNTAFYAAVAANPAVAQATAGLRAYGAAFHVRPGVEIDSTPGGNLTVEGDLDLHGFRYGAAREPGALILRAANALAIYGSITDGFGTSPDAAIGDLDDNGWVLPGNGAATTQSLILPGPVTLFGDDVSTDQYFANASSFPGNVALSFAVTIGVGSSGQSLADDGTDAGPTLQPNAVLPVDVTLAQQYTFTQPSLVRATIYDPTQNLTILAGTTVPAGTTLFQGTQVSAGNSFPIGISDPTTFPQPSPPVISPGAILPAGAVFDSVFGFADTAIPLGATTVLPAGTLLPANSMLFAASANGLAATTGNINLRPVVNGIQGLILPLAPLLPAGSQSWSIGLVAGADLAAADRHAVQTTAALAAGGASGTMTLNDPHFQRQQSAPNQPNFSVIRTGAADLGLFAGGDIQELTPYGIYTAGAQSAPPPGLTQTAADTLFDLPRGVALGATFSAPPSALVLGNGSQIYSVLVGAAAYHANYPDGGGNLTVAAQGTILPFAPADTASRPPSNDDIGNWLFRQGGSANTATAGQAPAYWINFGTYVLSQEINSSNTAISLDGFTGFGALGGGNVAITTGGGAGTGTNGSNPAAALYVAAAATGRIVDGALDQTGGGDVTLRIGGALGGGTVTDLRGQVLVGAAQIGQVTEGFAPNSVDPRAGGITAPTGALAATGGLLVVPGDATVTLRTLGDLVLDSVGDAGRVTQAVLSPIAQTVTASQPPVLVNGVQVLVAGGQTDFSLWQQGTAVDLFAAGGNLAPQSGVNPAAAANAPQPDTNVIDPPTLRAVAASGDIFASPTAVLPIELAPAPRGQLELLAQGSVIGGAFTESGAQPSTLSSPLAPSATPSLFAHGTDAATGLLHAGDPVPTRVYAVAGDVIGVQVGEALSSPDSPVVAATAAQIRAGRDLVSLGQNDLAEQMLTVRGFLTQETGDVFVNNNLSDVSVLQAGRDILYANAEVYGPGNLVVEAGRNVFQGSLGILKTLGPINQRSGGAGIVVLAGVGAAGPDYVGFARRYLASGTAAVIDPANPNAQAYLTQLHAYMAATYGVAGTDAAVLAAFAALPAEAQGVFLLPLYFEELRLSGREFTDPTSIRAKSYARGRTAIATLFPDTAAYAGSLTLQPNVQPAGGAAAPGGSVLTNEGGAISLLNPGGAILLGSNSLPSPAGDGILTQGQGDIGIYALGSVLLGQSRVFTTFGGGITMWSATGDLNAGRGNSSTDTFSPLAIFYDVFGNVSVSPNSATTGAGIATLAPIAGTVPGDVDLVAPQGTIDAGEAGIRVSGNVNLSALTVLNAANIQVSGKSTGLSAVVVPNVAALAAANTTSAATSQSASAAAHAAQSQGQAQASVITVEVVDFSN